MIPKSQLKWQKENRKTISANLSIKADNDIIQYLDNVKSVSETIKKAIRLLIKIENGGQGGK